MGVGGGCGGDVIGAFNLRVLGPVLAPFEF